MEQIFASRSKRLSIFAGLTENLKPEDARKAAFVCAVSTAVTLLLMLWAGNSVLDFFPSGSYIVESVVL